MKIQHIQNTETMKSLFSDEFAVQTCYLGRYGQEIGSDQFGAMIMVSQGSNITNDSQKVAVRLSNVEVNN
jgi:hypothetical protein